MHTLRRVIPSLILLAFFGSCGESDESTSPQDPSNLLVAVELDQDAGEVSVSATADNVDFFEFEAGDGSTVVTNTSGEFSHSYQSSGTYSLLVRAYGQSGRFLQEERVIAITLTNEEFPQYEGFTLAWQDEFNTTALNTLNWNFETGDFGGGNNEIQYYRTENTQVTGGNLVITAKEEDFGGRSYTSSRITTEDKYEFKYGRVDIRAKLPEGQGLWPALWMLGSNWSIVGWPACGEIDIVEMIGGSGRENTVHGTLHWQDPNGEVGNNFRAQFGRSFTADDSFSDDFHIFSLVWNEAEIKWYVDDILYSTQSISDPNKSEFQNPFFFIFNVAVGGNWPGSPDASTIFPQQMLVDYVRVYQED